MLVVALISIDFYSSGTEATRSTIIWLAFASVAFLVLVVAVISSPVEALGSQTKARPGAPTRATVLKYLVLGPTVLSAACVGYAVGVYRTTKPPDLTSITGQFDKPAPKRVVKPNEIIECTGSVQGLMKGEHLWLAVYSEGFYWPRRERVLVRKSDWSGIVLEKECAA